MIWLVMIIIITEYNFNKFYKPFSDISSEIKNWYDNKSIIVCHFEMKVNGEIQQEEQNRCW